MEIKNHFLIVQRLLVQAEHFWFAGKYSSSLFSLTKAFPHVRELITKIYDLDRESAAKALLDQETPG